MDEIGVRHEPNLRLPAAPTNQQREPSQAKPALALFPDATIHRFEHCGHFPHWDQPGDTVRLILDSTG